MLDGPTSVGKTSLVNYIANKIGMKLIRINNHKETNIEEYMGQFSP